MKRPRLPVELWLQIFEELDYLTLGFVIPRVCTLFKDIVKLGGKRLDEILFRRRPGRVSGEAVLKPESLRLHPMLSALACEHENPILKKIRADQKMKPGVLRPPTCIRLTKYQIDANGFSSPHPWTHTGSALIADYVEEEPGVFSTFKNSPFYNEGVVSPNVLLLSMRFEIPAEFLHLELLPRRRLPGIDIFSPAGVVTLSSLAESVSDMMVGEYMKTGRYAFEVKNLRWEEWTGRYVEEWLNGDGRLVGVDAKERKAVEEFVNQGNLDERIPAASVLLKLVWSEVEEFDNVQELDDNNGYTKRCWFVTS